MQNKFKNRCETIFIVFNILVPLAIGAYIYAYWGGDTYFGNWIRRFLTVPKVNIDADIIKFIRNWGCDFIWSYTLFFELYASTKSMVSSIHYAVICSILVESVQLIQLDFVKCGTFDLLDIVVEIIAACTAAIVLSFYYYIKRGRK